MIKTVVFDLGRVLLEFEPLEYLRSRIDDEALAIRLCKIIFQSEEWLALDRGTISEADAIERFVRRNPELETVIRYAMKDWYELLQPKTDSVAILQELKAKGCRLLILSNFHQAAREAVCAKHLFFRVFDGGIFSYEVKLLKPETEIYQTLLQRYQLTAEETVFIDDTLENIEASKRLGIKGIHFRSAAELRLQLQALSLL
ncbi:HAD family phosphatase [Azotosporobacter soli]|uniref:HAD family hydrolase n=1 Tax=Azotosporobacter soli TaxID=3055040 RepID=UPI0031FE8D2B